MADRGVGKGKEGYREIFGILRTEILAGKYDRELRLPSENQLARRFHVCRPTASKAMSELAQVGLIVRRQGTPALLSRFAKNATGVIGLIVQGEWNESDVFPRICRRIRDLAERSGWRIVRHCIMSKTKRERMAEIKEVAKRFVNEHVAAAFFQPMEGSCASFQCNQDVVSSFSAAGIQVVLLDYDIGAMPCRSGFDLVGVDNFSAGYALGRHLLDRGAKKISFLSYRYSPNSVQDRKRGVMAAIIESGIEWRPQAYDMTCESLTRKAVMDFVDRHSPDAIVAWNDRAALSVFAILARQGIVIPDEIMLAGFDDIAEVATAPVPLTTMRQPIDVLAAVALHTLVSRIKDSTLPPRKTMAPCELVQRMSTMR